MKALIQRVKEAKVEINNQIYSSIKNGLLVFLGIEKNDTDKNSMYLIEKIINLRIFSNEQGKFDLSLKDINGQLLLVSQFTLCANTKKGKRPDFTNAEKPDIAKKIYNNFISFLEEKNIKFKTGVFQAEMLVSLINDGPVTILLEDKNEN